MIRILFQTARYTHYMHNEFLHKLWNKPVLSTKVRKYCAYNGVYCTKYNLVILTTDANRVFT